MEAQTRRAYQELSESAAVGHRVPSNNAPSCRHNSVVVGNNHASIRGFVGLHSACIHDELPGLQQRRHATTTSGNVVGDRGVRERAPSSIGVHNTTIRAGRVVTHTTSLEGESTPQSDIRRATKGGHVVCDDGIRQLHAS